MLKEATFAAAAGILLLAPGLASAQAYPVKPIRIYTAGVGGGNDFVSRIIAQGISGPLGQSVVVDNRASTILAAEVVAKAPPDGYSLLVAGGVFTIGPLMQQTSYDVLRDFAPVIMTGVVANVVVVHPSLPVKSAKDLVALARARAGELNYASASPGSSSHLAAELFKSMARINMVRVTYKNTGQAVASIVGGETQVMFPNIPSAGTHVKSGRLRALAVTTLQRSALMPDLPTVAASGLPGYEATSMDGVYVPARTPAAIIGRLNQEIARAINTPETKEKFLNVGTEITGGPPEQLATAVKTEIAVWGKVIKEAGIRLD